MFKYLYRFIAFLQKILSPINYKNEIIIQFLIGGLKNCILFTRILCYKFIADTIQALTPYSYCHLNQIKDAMSET